eukprot:575197-Amphidinium_carterae.1
MAWGSTGVPCALDRYGKVLERSSTGGPCTLDKKVHGLPLSVPQETEHRGRNDSQRVQHTNGAMEAMESLPQTMGSQGILRFTQ